MTTQTARSADRLSFPRLLAFAGGSVPGYMLLGLMGVYLPRYYAGHLGIDLIKLGLAISLIRFADLAVDLFLGMVMDQVKTPLGRYRPWYLVGLPVVLLGVYKVFNPPDDAGLTYLFIWYPFLFLAYSLLVVGHTAWAGTLSGSYHERSRIFGWMMGLSLAGNVTINALPFLTSGAINPAKSASIPTIGWILMAVAVVAMPLATFIAPEREPPVAPKDKPTFKDYMSVFTKPTMVRLILADLFLTLGPGVTGPIYIFFFKDAKQFTLVEVPTLLIFYTFAGVLGAPIWSRVAQKIGKHRTIQIAAVAYAITQSILMALPAGQFAVTAVGMFAVGFCASAFILLIRAMVADVADEFRLETGRERAGILFALVTLTQKLGTTLSAGIILPILGVMGYNARDGAVNTPEAIHGLEMCYLFAPIILVFLGSFFFFGYKMTAERHSEIRTQLEALAAKDVEAAHESLVGVGEASPVR